MYDSLPNASGSNGSSDQVGVKILTVAASPYAPHAGVARLSFAEIRSGQYSRFF